MTPGLGASLRVIVAQELVMQLRQRMTVVMIVLLPMFGVPAALWGTSAYQGTVEQVADATRAKRKYDLDDRLPVSVPDEIRAWIRETDGLEVVSPDRALATMTFDGSVARIAHAPNVASTQARSRLASVVERRSTQLRWAALDAAGIPPSKGYGLSWKLEDRTAGSPGGVLIVPLAMLTMLMAAAFTALDVLTGERERGTLETLLCTGADRRVVIAAKTLVVAIATLAAGGSAVLGVIVAGSLGAPGVPPIGALQGLALAAAVGTLGVIATAIAVSFAISAPSYRSASLTMGIVLLLPAIPAGLGTLPFELTPVMAAIPIGNVSLAVRDAFVGTLTLADAALVGLASAAWVTIAVAAALGRVGSEGALLQAHDPLALRRAGFFGRQAAGVFALMLLLVWIVGSPVQTVNLAWGLVWTEVVLIAGVALAGVAWVGLPMRDTLSLRAPARRDLALAVLAGVCAPGIGTWMVRLQDPVLPSPALDLAELVASVPTWLVVPLFAVLPAVCEEIAFRGALFGMMRRSPPVARVVANALMFGAIHLSVHRMLPTTALGLLIATVTLRSGSLWPAVVVHLLNNAIAVHLPGDLPAWAPLAQLGAAAVAIGAVAAMGRSESGRVSDRPAAPPAPAATPAAAPPPLGSRPDRTAG